MSGTVRLSSEDLAALAELRRRRPRVQCVLGAVSAPFVADVILAAGGVPSMTHAPDEAAMLAAGADAVLVNTGQPDAERRAGARACARGAAEAGRPWLLDPVLAHATPARLQLAEELLGHAPAIIKPNRQELAALSPAGGNPEEATRVLARSRGAIVQCTGDPDIITGGDGIHRISGGHEWMDRAVGFGCALGGLTAALLAVTDPQRAALAACRTFAHAAHLALGRARGPASFRIAFVDVLHQLSEEAE